MHRKSFLSFCLPIAFFGSQLVLLINYAIGLSTLNIENEITAAAEKVCKRLGHMLRDRQWEVVVRFVHGRDVFVSLPTVSGKILYQAMSVCLTR